MMLAFADAREVGQAVIGRRAVLFFMIISSIRAAIDIPPSLPDRPARRLPDKYRRKNRNRHRLSGSRPLNFSPLPLGEGSGVRSSCFAKPCPLTPALSPGGEREQGYFSITCKWIADGYFGERCTCWRAIWKSSSVASKMLGTNFCGLRSISGNQVLWTCTMILCPLRKQ
jgi:hypothetical protein